MITKEDLQHTAHFQIRCGEIDAQRKIKISAFVELLQETSMQHIIKLKASAWDLEARRMSWILLRKRIDIITLPKIGETIKVVTKPTGFAGYFAHRDYLVYDAEDTLIASASSYWTLMDMSQRKMIRIPEDLLDLVHPDDSEYLPRVDKRIKKQKNVDQTIELKVYQTHLDWNNHVNNVNYLKWMLMSLPQEKYSGKTPKSVNIHFKGEAMLGDIITAQLTIQEDQTLHQIIKNDDNKLVAIAEISW